MNTHNIPASNMVPITIQCENLEQVVGLIFGKNGTIRPIVMEGIEKSLSCDFLNEGLLNPAIADPCEAMLALSGNLLGDVPFSTGIRMIRKEEIDALMYIIQSRPNYEEATDDRDGALELKYYSDESVLWFCNMAYTNMVAAWLRKINVGFKVEFNDRVDNENPEKVAVDMGDDIPCL